MPVTLPRAISVAQPWAWAIAERQMPAITHHRVVSHRGLIAIHASRHSNPEDVVRLQTMMSWVPGDLLMRVPHGALIATATLTDCHPAGDCCAPCDNRYRYRDQYHLALIDVTPLAEPIPCHGDSGVWRVPRETARLLTAQAGKPCSG